MKIEDFIFAKMSQKNKTFLARISFDISYKFQKFQKSYEFFILLEISEITFPFAKRESFFLRISNHRTTLSQKSIKLY